MLKNKTIIITGGTGTFGTNFIEYILKKKIKVKKVIIFSRDEFKQTEMQNRFANNKFLNLRYFIGDIRDKDRLRMALEDVDIILHAAAIKHVPIAEYNPFEAIKTNVLGVQNLIEVALEKNIEKFISLSTDKAAAPVNLYGATKLCADKLVTSSQNIKGKKKTIFSVVRYGNVFGSRGSVVPKFIKDNKSVSELKITDLSMTRFSLSINKAIEVVMWAIKNSVGGEILIPKIPSYKLIDLAKAINPKVKLKIIGIRQGEKVHEEMITSMDSHNCYSFKEYFAILEKSNKKSINLYKKKYVAKKVKPGFSYNSFTNKTYLTIKEIKKELKEFSKKKVMI
jgi:UDP-N-acetylglucosamine 4,6-dehydratase/5-epimerase